MGSLRAMWLQCGITAALACLFFWLFKDEPGGPKVPLFAGLIGGFGSHWLLMFCYVWIRYGWRSASSMRMYGND